MEDVIHINFYKMVFGEDGTSSLLRMSIGPSGEIESPQPGADTLGNLHYGLLSVCTELQSGRLLSSDSGSESQTPPTEGIKSRVATVANGRTVFFASPLPWKDGKSSRVAEGGYQGEVMFVLDFPARFRDVAVSVSDSFLHALLYSGIPLSLWKKCCLLGVHQQHNDLPVETSSGEEDEKEMVESSNANLLSHLVSASSATSFLGARRLQPGIPIRKIIMTYFKRLFDVGGVGGISAGGRIAQPGSRAATTSTTHEQQQASGADSDYTFPPEVPEVLSNFVQENGTRAWFLPSSTSTEQGAAGVFGALLTSSMSTSVISSSAAQVSMARVPLTSKDSNTQQHQQEVETTTSSAGKTGSVHDSGAKPKKYDEYVFELLNLTRCVPLNTALWKSSSPSAKTMKRGLPVAFIEKVYSDCHTAVRVSSTMKVGSILAPLVSFWCNCAASLPSVWGDYYGLGDANEDDRCGSHSSIVVPVQYPHNLEPPKVGGFLLRKKESNQYLMLSIASPSPAHIKVDGDWSEKSDETPVDAGKVGHEMTRGGSGEVRDTKSTTPVESVAEHQQSEHIFTACLITPSGSPFMGAPPTVLTRNLLSVVQRGVALQKKVARCSSPVGCSTRQQLQSNFPRSHPMATFARQLRHQLGVVVVRVERLAFCYIGGVPSLVSKGSGVSVAHLHTNWRSLVSLPPTLTSGSSAASTATQQCLFDLSSYTLTTSGVSRAFSMSSATQLVEGVVISKHKGGRGKPCVVAATTTTCTDLIGPVAVVSSGASSSGSVVVYVCISVGVRREEKGFTNKSDYYAQQQQRQGDVGAVSSEWARTFTSHVARCS